MMATKKRESWDASECAWRLKEAVHSGRFSKNDADVAAIEGAIDVLFRMYDQAYVGENEAASRFAAAIQVLFNEGDAYKAEIATLKSKVATLESKVATLEADNATLKTDNASMKNALLLRQFASCFEKGIKVISFADAWPSMSQKSRRNILRFCQLRHLQNSTYDSKEIHYAKREPFLKACEAFWSFFDEVKELTELSLYDFLYDLEILKGPGNITAHPDFVEDVGIDEIPALIGKVCQHCSTETQKELHKMVSVAKIAEERFHWMAMASQKL